MKIYQNEPKVQHPHNSAQAKEGAKDTYLTQLDRKHHGNALQVQPGAHHAKAVVIGASQGSAAPWGRSPPPSAARPLLRKAVSRSHAEAVHAGIPTKKSCKPCSTTSTHGGMQRIEWPPFLLSTCKRRPPPPLYRQQHLKAKSTPHLSNTPRA
jgi:hypothetical protein